MRKTIMGDMWLALRRKQNIWRILQMRVRRKRFAYFKKLIAPLARPLYILDVGGTQEFWEQMKFAGEDVRVVLYNLTCVEITHPNMISMVGDARYMREFAEKQFDVVFSNSVLEHVGTYDQQEMMAKEVRRVAKRYWVQTPNRYFPIEPHVLWPFFQFLSPDLQVSLLSRFRSLWGWKISGRAEAIAYVHGIRLLSEKELRQLFPGARIFKERFLGLTKSFIVCDGW